MATPKHNNSWPSIQRFLCYSLSICHEEKMHYILRNIFHNPRIFIRKTKHIITNIVRKEEFTKVVNFMTPWAGVLVPGHGNISHILKRLRDGCWPTIVEYPFNIYFLIFICFTSWFECLFTCESSTICDSVVRLCLYYFILVPSKSSSKFQDPNYETQNENYAPLNDSLKRA